MPNPEDYQVFISYCKLTGKSFARHIIEIFGTRHLRDFAIHLEQPHTKGTWEKFINEVIQHSKIFVPLLTVDTLKKPQVKIELEQLKKNATTPENFRIVRYDIPEVPRNYSILDPITKDLSDIIQIDFTTRTCLLILTLC